MVDEFILFEDLDGTKKRSVVWLSNGRDSWPSCPVYPVSGNSITGVGEANNCDELHPFVCKRMSVVPCKNACFNNGACMGITCVCFRCVAGFSS